MPANETGGYLHPPQTIALFCRTASLVKKREKQRKCRYFILLLF